MKTQKFAVIDVETTGGFAAGHRVTEVGIAISDGQKIIAEYHSLINPEMHIPEYITSLTGIDNNTVRNAPRFAEVAAEIKTYLDDAIFVAHNVEFDFSFIRNEMQLAGIDFKAQKLCTVRYARSLLKDQPKFNLARLAQRFKIVNKDPHRALADAQTAAHILHRLIAMDDENIIDKKIVQLAKEVKVPSGLAPEKFHNLPQVPGVYFFYGADGKPLYIGKAKDVKSRVTTHFRNAETAKTQAFMRNITDIKTYETGSEFLALIKEDVEIRKHWPPHNSAQKRANISFHIICYLDHKGAQHLGVKKARIASDAIETFQSLRAANDWLHQQVRTFKLAPKYCQLPDNIFDFKPPELDEHNARVDALKEALEGTKRSFLVLEKGRNSAENGFVLVEAGNVKAMGFAPRNIEWNNRDVLAEYAEHVYSSPTLQQIVASYITTNEAVRLVEIDE